MQHYISSLGLLADAAAGKSEGGKDAKADFEEVFARELQEVCSRRQLLNDELHNKLDVNDVKNSLCGLALSGGGVRSATFSLGVLQVLVETGIYRTFDYLSTVSGGGYIGCTLSSLHAADSSKEACYVDPPIYSAHPRHKVESPTISHLRDFSKYLTPLGKGGLFRIFALLLLGFATNILLTLPALIVISFLIIATLLFGSFASTTFWLILVFVTWTAFYAISVSRPVPFERSHSRQPLWLKWTAILITGLLILTFLRIQPDAIKFVKSMIDISPIDTLQWAFGSVSALGVLLGVVGVLIKRFSGLGNKLLSVSLGLIAPALLWLLVLLLVSTLDDPCSWHRFEKFSGLSIVETFRGTLNHLQSTLLLYPSSCYIEATDRSPIVTLVFREDLLTVVTFFALVAVALLGFAMLVNVNSTSLHTFYRDKLADTYIFGREKFRRMRLSDLSAAGPYHLINASINIQNSRKNLRGRDADIFFFSKYYCGSAITGWCRTKKLERVDPNVDIAAAMAISGAAVAPNQGRSTNRPLRFLLAIVNARLGYWLANPHHVQTGVSVKRRTSPYYFLLELFGLLDETRQRVYLSDGGHIENLGVYELLRRRCKFIVIVDAECDSSRTFFGLAHMIRIAKIDFNYEVKFSMRDIEAAETGISRAHCALGTVAYDRNTHGTILYIKASLTGDENEYITEYRKRFKSFPHESTTDQFFTEEQFEAYRSLGHHIASEVATGFSGDIESHFISLQQRLAIDVIDIESYLLVQARIQNILQHTRAAANVSDPSAKHSLLLAGLDRKLFLIEFAVLRLKLNDDYIAAGRCRNIVLTFTEWVRAPEMLNHWRQQSGRFGAEANQFIKNARCDSQQEMSVKNTA